MVKELEQGRGGCKRKLTWPVELAQAADTAEDAGAWSPEPHSPVHKHDDVEPPDSGCPKSACQGEVLLRSPTHDGVIFTLPEVKRARFLDLLDSSSLAGPSGATAEAGGAAAGAAGPDNQQLTVAAATSSSRRSWDLLFDGLQQPGRAVHAAAAPAPATPAAVVVSALPAPPQKPGQHRCVGCRAPFRSSRALAGMAPASDADLQQMRAWLSTLEAR